MKKVTSFILCLSLCLGLSVPVIAEGSPEEFTVTVKPSVGGNISTSGGVTIATNTAISADSGGFIEFIITPVPGYKVEQVLVEYPDGFIDDRSFLLKLEGDSYKFLLDEIDSYLTLQVVYKQEDISELLSNDFVVLNSEVGPEPYDDLKGALRSHMGSFGYIVSTGAIKITEVSNAAIETISYGAFKFTVTLGGVTSREKTGYIIKNEKDVIFKLTDSYGNEEIVVAGAAQLTTMEVGVPAMNSGYMEVMGYRNFIAAPLDGGLQDDLVDGKIPLPFYSAQFHLINFSLADFNYYGVYVIQEDALCVQVAAKKGDSEQKTLQWDVGRYVNLTNGKGVSDVFFGNENFELTIPQSGIGSLVSLSAMDGDFPGYRITKTAINKYEVSFLSDYYDNITLDLTVNDNVSRQLNVKRVGVQIEAYEWEDGPPTFNVWHGTQISTAIDFSGPNKYHVYGTYCIPDGGTTSPYGLYVTYTWADGSKTTKIITEPCDNPSGEANADKYEGGVFEYNNFANCCDYLLYEGPTKSGAPVKINVSVLKGDLNTGGTFNGITFGSGAGVTWTKK